MFRMWIVSGSSGYVSANHHIYHTFIVHFLRLNILLNRLVVFAIRLLHLFVDIDWDGGSECWRLQFLVLLHFQHL